MGTPPHAIGPPSKSCWLQNMVSQLRQGLAKPRVSHGVFELTLTGSRRRQEVCVSVAVDSSTCTTLTPPSPPPRAP